ncbi:hypothetical protein BDZ94DRAFT_1316995 [Collybia nuda]|uniref:Uncharacterized protein n=1 Tax=Collybia nuda TaxID=64659 RepID=A0A9P5YJQ6_9AGAR|nr:hypothetical protein BDZ94DRAFT_1316995 [Collybia nuda]
MISSEATDGIKLSLLPRCGGGVSDRVIEREMGTHQRGLIDTCLEEGQFDSAIALLDQLRSSIYKPHASHIRQMIYIALQPVHPNDNPVRIAIDNSATSSPSKSTKQYAPSGGAILASRRLLMSFAMTNSPGALARALPRYEDPTDQEPLPEDDPCDSAIGKEAMCISHAKNCWSILSQDFLRRQRQIPSSPNKGKKRGQTWDDETSENPLTNPLAVVGENSWPVLDWLLLLFEQDQDLTGCHSPLLLKQIPYPRHGGNTRWDTELPLNIVFHCFDQADLRRRRMGSRLMSLLINLSSTGHLDIRMFIASIFSHFSPPPFEKLPLFFSELIPTVPTHRLKVILCQKILMETVHSNTPSSARPSVHARAHPRALRTDPTNGGASWSAPVNNATLPLSNKYFLPNPNEIRQLLEMNVDMTSSGGITKSLLMRVKFELLVSFRAIHHTNLNDLEWSNFTQKSNLDKILDLVFNPNDGGEIYRNLLKNLLNV